MKSNSQSGYIGLLSLLIATLIIAWWAWVGFNKVPKNETQSGVSTEEIQTIPGQLKTIDKAKEAKSTIENLNKKMTEGL